MSAKEVHPSVAQRIIIKFLMKEGVRPAEILCRLRQQFKSTFSQPCVFFWHKTFSGVRERVENESHDRRPRTSLTEDNTREVRDLLEIDRCITIAEIAAHLGNRYDSIQKIIIDELGYRKMSA
ncbi:hypothetical protein ALC62_10488 [Cyphomyrmex costatus]|uniref:Mos1 transposase HTH domain-containing protein n=1 Tax=Cyphomyrmex costatus TaxID=456900 RepID=A0A151IDL2_9HYME|nr:hypothetical protein ALC62_10488 [Cyphomyrmex costatus]